MRPFPRLPSRLRPLVQTRLDAAIGLNSTLSSLQSTNLPTSPQEGPLHLPSTWQPLPDCPPSSAGSVALSSENTTCPYRQQSVSAHRGPLGQPSEYPLHLYLSLSPSQPARVAGLSPSPSWPTWRALSSPRPRIAHPLAVPLCPSAHFPARQSCPRPPAPTAITWMRRMNPPSHRPPTLSPLPLPATVDASEVSWKSHAIFKSTSHLLPPLLHASSRRGPQAYCGRPALLGLRHALPHAARHCPCGHTAQWWAPRVPDPCARIGPPRSIPSRFCSGPPQSIQANVGYLLQSCRLDPAPLSLLLPMQPPRAGRLPTSLGPSQTPCQISIFGASAAVCIIIGHLGVCVCVFVCAMWRNRAQAEWPPS